MDAVAKAATMDISLKPKTGSFTALRATVDGALKINTDGGEGSWSGTSGKTVKIEAVGVGGAEFECSVKGGGFNHSQTHTLPSNGRFSETL